MNVPLDGPRDVDELPHFGDHRLVPVQLYPQQVADPSGDRVSHGPAILAMHGVDSPRVGHRRPAECRRLGPRRFMRQPSTLPSCHTAGTAGPGGHRHRAPGGVRGELLLDCDPRRIAAVRREAPPVFWVYPGFPTLFWGLSVFFVGDLMGKALWKPVENAARFPRRGGRVLCVHGAVSFHRARPCGPRWLPGRGAMRHVELDRRVLGLQSTGE